MDMPSIVAGCLNGLGTAVAAVELADWRFVFANHRFERLFPAADDHLPGRLPGFQPGPALDRLREGWSWRTEIETGDPTPVCVAVEVRVLPEAPTLALVEARDIGKQKRAEYMLDSYSRLAERHARQLARETERAEKLLLNVMPRSVYEEMKNYGAVTPQRFDEASVVMLDFVGFTEMAVAANPSALVAELNDIFAAFDRIVELFGCERIKTVGDCYIAVSGLPEPSPDHVGNAARAALRLIIGARWAASPRGVQCRGGVRAPCDRRGMRCGGGEPTV